MNKNPNNLRLPELFTEEKQLQENLALKLRVEELFQVRLLHRRRKLRSKRNSRQTKVRGQLYGQPVHALGYPCTRPRISLATPTRQQRGKRTCQSHCRPSMDEEELVKVEAPKSLISAVANQVVNGGHSPFGDQSHLVSKILRQRRSWNVQGPM